MAGTALSSLDVEATFVAGGDIESNSVEQTAAAMRAGAPVIVQGALETNGWRGRADILYQGDEHQRAQALIVARYPQLRSMNIADLPVIALRIARVASWGDLSVP